MRKILCIIISNLLIVLILSGCINTNQDSVVNVWMFEKEYDSQTPKDAERIKKYCEENNIPLKLHYYKENEISYEDYIFKRNINLTSGNTIGVNSSIENLIINTVLLRIQQPEKGQDLDRLIENSINQIKLKL